MKEDILRNSTVIMNEKDEFLDFDMKSWTTSDGHFFTGTRPNAIRVARRLKRMSSVFIITNYGYADQVKEEVVNGDVIPFEEDREFVPLTREDAKIRGFIVDDTCYPWFGEQSVQSQT
jgi:hypothetical protein